MRDHLIYSRRCQPSEEHPDGVQSFAAVLLAVESTSEEAGPIVQLAFLDPKRADALTGADWRIAIDRATDVPYGTGQRHWFTESDKVETPAPVEPEPEATPEPEPPAVPVTEVPQSPTPDETL